MLDKKKLRRSSSLSACLLPGVHACELIRCVRPLCPWHISSSIQQIRLDGSVIYGLTKERAIKGMIMRADSTLTEQQLILKCWLAAFYSIRIDSDNKTKWHRIYIYHLVQPEQRICDQHQGRIIHNPSSATRLERGAYICICTCSCMST